MMKLTGSWDEVYTMKQVYDREGISSKIYAVGFNGLYYILVECVCDE